MYFLIIVCALATIVLFGEFLVSEKLRVDSLQGNEFLSLGFLDSVGVSLVGIVVCASVLLL